MPGFLNNHIENLTINAPPGFEMPAQAQLEASQTNEREGNTMNNGAPFVSTPTAAIRPLAEADKSFELVLAHDEGMLS